MVKCILALYTSFSVSKIFLWANSFQFRGKKAGPGPFSPFTGWTFSRRVSYLFTYTVKCTGINERTARDAHLRYTGPDREAIPKVRSPASSLVWLSGSPGPFLTGTFL